MTTRFATVLVVEDEKAYSDALQLALTRESFNVVVASTGQEALVKFAESDPDVVLLDLMLPGVSGTDVCREIRRKSSTPIIMVTAKDAELDKVLGLELGADDYITKPYSLRELIARIRAVLRRTTAPTTDKSELLIIGNIELDLARHAARIDGEEIALPLREFNLLEALMSNAGRAVTRASLMDQVWGYDYVGDTKTLDVHIQRLRSRIEADPANPQFISTVRGLGYRFERVKDSNDA